jgi:hypothetical protein
MVRFRKPVSCMRIGGAGWALPAVAYAAQGARQQAIASETARNLDERSIWNETTK